MKKKKVLSAITALILVLSFILSGCEGGQEAGKQKDESKKPQKVKLIYAHPSSEASNNHRLGLKLKEEVERISNGTIEIQVLANHGGEREILESVQRGDVGFTITSIAPLVNFEPTMAVFDVPFLFPAKETPEETMKEVFKVFETDAAKGTMKPLEEKNIRGLGYLGLGFRALAINKEISTIDELKGLKIRTMENENHIAEWKALGANPTPMAFNEVYTGLEQHTIDAQEQPFDTLDAYKFYEIQKYVITIDMIFNTTLFSMSKMAYDQLTVEQQGYIDKAVENAIVYGRQDAIDSLHKNVESLKANDVKIYSFPKAEKQKAIELTAPVEKKIRGEIGDEIVDLFKNALK